MDAARLKKGRLVGEDGIKSNLIPLSLIFDYPVRWSKYKVLRDLIQNFYDAVGHQEWDRRFSYELNGKGLLFKAAHVDFSYDWLIHIGASTKRDSLGQYAGYFGEGFKVASLCALRDHGWNIEMASRDWELMVVTSTLEVDGRDLTSLAYQVWRKEKKRKETILCIYPFHQEDTDILKSVLMSFCYEKNPLFGKKIWSSPRAAVFYRSNDPKPNYYPCTFQYGGDGIVFGGYQAMGSFEYPLIFCLHGFRLNDRERNSFFRMDVIQLIGRTVEELPPEAAAEVLRMMKSRWYEYPRKKFDFHSLYPIIKTLTRIVAKSCEQKALWRQKYPGLLVATQVRKTDLQAYNRRRQALAWLRDSEKKYRLVQDGFGALGYPTLEQLCEEHGGFSVVRDPHGKEIELIQLIEAATSALLGDFLKNKRLPPCKIIRSESAVWSGMTSCVALKQPECTSMGLKIRYDLPYVGLKKGLLDKGHFGNALSTYLHELAHMFGGDRSATFSRALTKILDISLTNSRLIGQFQKKWDLST